MSQRMNDFNAMNQDSTGWRHTAASPAGFSRDYVSINGEWESPPNVTNMLPRSVQVRPVNNSDFPSPNPTITYDENRYAFSIASAKEEMTNSLNSIYQAVHNTLHKMDSVSCSRVSDAPQQQELSQKMELIFYMIGLLQKAWDKRCDRSGDEKRIGELETQLNYVENEKHKALRNKIEAETSLRENKELTATLRMEVNTLLEKLKKRDGYIAELDQKNRKLVKSLSHSSRSAPPMVYDVPVKELIQNAAEAKQQLDECRANCREKDVVLLQRSLEHLERLEKVSKLETDNKYLEASLSQLKSEKESLESDIFLLEAQLNAKTEEKIHDEREKFDAQVAELRSNITIYAQKLEEKDADIQSVIVEREKVQKNCSDLEEKQLKMDLELAMRKSEANSFITRYTRCNDELKETSYELSQLKEKLGKFEENEENNEEASLKLLETKAKLQISEGQVKQLTSKCERLEEQLASERKKAEMAGFELKDFETEVSEEIEKKKDDYDKLLKERQEAIEKANTISKELDDALEKLAECQTELEKKDKVIFRVESKKRKDEEVEFEFQTRLQDHVNKVETALTIARNEDSALRQQMKEIEKERDGETEKCQTLRNRCSELESKMETLVAESSTEDGKDVKELRVKISKMRKENDARSTKSWEEQNMLENEKQQLKVQLERKEKEVIQLTGWYQQYELLKRQFDPLYGELQAKNAELTSLQFQNSSLTNELAFERKMKAEVLSQKDLEISRLKDCILLFREYFGALATMRDLPNNLKVQFNLYTKKAADDFATDRGRVAIRSHLKRLRQYDVSDERDRKRLRLDFAILQNKCVETDVVAVVQEIVTATVQSEINAKNSANLGDRHNLAHFVTDLYALRAEAVQLKSGVQNQMTQMKEGLGDVGVSLANLNSVRQDTVQYNRCLVLVSKELKECKLDLVSIRSQVTEQANHHKSDMKTLYYSMLRLVKLAKDNDFLLTQFQRQLRVNASLNAIISNLLNAAASTSKNQNVK